MQTDTVTVVSLAPYVVGEAHHELGNLTVPARGKDEEYAKKVVTDKITTKDFGDARKEPVTIKAKDVAEDIVGIHKDSSLIPHGVFIAAGDEPTAAELAAAKKKMEVFYREQINKADSIWARTRNRSQINGIALVAADYFHLRKEWAVDMSTMTPCPSCKELIQPDAIKCSKCAAFLNLDAARKMGLINKEQYEFMSAGVDVKVDGAPEDAEDVPVKRGPGRPRKVVGA